MPGQLSRLIYVYIQIDRRSQKNIHEYKRKKNFRGSQTMSKTNHLNSLILSFFIILYSSFLLYNSIITFWKMKSDRKEKEVIIYIKKHIVNNLYKVSLIMVYTQYIYRRRNRVERNKRNEMKEKP